MSELEEKIYLHFQTHAQYNFSSDMSTKSREIRAIKSLENSGYISVKANSIGFVIAEVI